jgi:hypothetical protein
VAKAVAFHLAMVACFLACQGCDQQKGVVAETEDDESCTGGYFDSCPVALVRLEAHGRKNLPE